MERRNKLRQEQTLRLTEMARVKREEKLTALTNNLTALLELQTQLKATRAREAAPVIEKIQALGVPEVRHKSSLFSLIKLNHIQVRHLDKSS